MSIKNTLFVLLEPNPAERAINLHLRSSSRPRCLYLYVMVAPLYPPYEYLDWTYLYKSDTRPPAFTRTYMARIKNTKNYH